MNSSTRFDEFAQPFKIDPMSELSALISRASVKGSQHSLGRATPHCNPDMPSYCLNVSLRRGKTSPAPSRCWETGTGGGVTSKKHSPAGGPHSSNQIDNVNQTS